MDAHNQDPAPQASPAVDRLADILLALETATAAGFRLAAVATFDAAHGWAGVVRLRLGDRAWGLSADETRMLARCIGFEDQRRATGLLVSLLLSAACDAEGMAAVAARAGRPAPTEVDKTLRAIAREETARGVALALGNPA